MRINDYLKRFLFLCLIGCFIVLIGSHKHLVRANEEGPKILYEVSKSKKGSVNLNLRFEDESGLKSIKYAVGRHRIPFFKYSHYASKVKKLDVTSTKKLSFLLNTKEKNRITFYVENKKGKVTHKVILAQLNSKGEASLNQNTSSPSTYNPEQTEDGKEVNQEGTEKSEISPPMVFDNKNERRAVWVSFLEFHKQGYTEKTFREKAVSILDETVNRNMNTVYMHVRPFSDAMYPSSYYPWSVYASGKEGRSPGFDPLAIMVEEAHKRGLKLHAYINPYRVNYANLFEKLKDDKEEYKWQNPAFRWLNDEDPSNDRNVLKHGSMYYYNPSKPEVINLITNGVKEICKNYEVDGVIFDDYFYPNLGTYYDKNFDSMEYAEYKKVMEEGGKTPLTIVNWRRENINQMVKKVYQAVKKAGKNQEFGISPAGNLKNLKSHYSYYVDIERWGREEGFVDYLEPQLYWGFENKVVPFDKNIQAWQAVVSNPKIKLYIALPIYRIVAKPSDEWKKNKFLLSDMLIYQRMAGVSGFSLFRYDFMLDGFLKKEVEKEGRDHFFNLLQ